MTQFAFDLPHRPALGREDFLLAPCNEVAVGWIDRWPAWPHAGLVICGPAGCGKSHLGSVWRTLSGALALDAEALCAREPPELMGDARACLLDDAEALFGAGAHAEAERALLHVYNMLAERRGHLLLTGSLAPARWAITLPDLRSRLSILPTVELGLPDERLLEVLLIKQFADRQVRVEAAVIRYLMARMERSFAAVRTLVEAIDRAALRKGCAITVPLVRDLLAERPAAAEDDAGGG